MTDRVARTAEQIRSEIVERLTFFPPFFAPALTNPAVLENLWQQTLHSYADSTLPRLWSERLFALLARYCDSAYLLVCHSCALRPLGMDATAILDLLDGPGLPDADAAVAALEAAPAAMTGWAEPGPVADAALRAAVSVYLRDDDHCRLAPALRRVVPVTDHERLMLFLGYVSTCLRWAEAHPQLPFEDDQRVIDHLRPLLSERPELGDYFARFPHQPAEITGGALASTGCVEDADRRFFLTFDHAPIGMALTELDGRFLRVNQALCQLVGYDETALTTMTCFDLTHPEDEALYRENVERLVAGNTPTFQMNKRYRHAGGNYLWILQSVALLRSGDGTPRYLISHTEDITEQRRHSERLAAANTELQRSNRDLLQFSAVAAHDLKGPLTTIVGGAELLIEDSGGGISAEDRELVERISAAATRMNQLVDDLLSLARVSTEPLQVQWVNLDALLAGLVADLGERLAAAGARVDIAAHGGVWAHPTHLRQVFYNLITNAVKYTAAGSQCVVDISAVEHDDDVTFTVADNGIGVPADAEESIFAMFHREHVDTADGTGVGLAICRRIVERHGGTIWMEQRPGGGSLFRFRLPRFPVGASPVVAGIPAHSGGRRERDARDVVA